MTLLQSVKELLLNMNNPVTYIIASIVLAIIGWWLSPIRRRIITRCKMCNELLLLDDKVFNRLKPPIWGFVFWRTRKSMRNCFRNYLAGRIFVKDLLWDMFIEGIQFGVYTPYDVHVEERNIFDVKISHDNWYECDEITVEWRQEKLGSNKIDMISRPHKYTKQQVAEIFHDIGVEEI